MGATTLQTFGTYGVDYPDANPAVSILNLSAKRPPLFIAGHAHVPILHCSGRDRLATFYTYVFRD